jgi:phosphatidylglycerol lysyltransferase
MLWGRQQGFEWFNLGMAPLSGIEAQPLAPLWNRFAAALYHHGEYFYHFQGIREYKEKFYPVWRPKYLATRGGIALPVVMANVVTLISGGPEEAAHAIAERFLEAFESLGQVGQSEAGAAMRTASGGDYRSRDKK